MKRTPARRSNLFLMELIIAILFFSLAGALCMQLFLKARTLAAETSNQNHALTQAKSAAAVFEAGDGTLDGILQFFPGSTLSDSGEELNVYYDKSWNLCDKSDSRFQMKVLIQNRPDMDMGDKSWNSDGTSDRTSKETSDGISDRTSEEISGKASDWTSDGTLVFGRIVVFDGDENLCSLEISCYLPLKADI